MNLKTFEQFQQSIKKGVDFVFKQNPELYKIGTQQQYTDYLNTVFPNSKVDDILYHTSRNKFDIFDKNKRQTNDWGSMGAGFYFYGWVSEFGKYVYPCLLNIKKLYIASKNDYSLLNTLQSKDKSLEFTNNLISKGYDGIQLENNTETAVFEPEQIHILGSKQDIDNFKNFISIS
jgi:hypothetical protein